MEVATPVLGQDSRSPLGYRVVEVAHEQVPGACAPATTNADDERQGKAPPKRRAWSPAGYRVVQVAEEHGPGRPRALSPRSRAPQKRAEYQYVLVWAGIVFGGLIVTGFVIAMTVALQTRPGTPAAPAFVHVHEPTIVRDDPPRQPPRVQIPAVEPAQAQEKDPLEAPPALAKEGCAANGLGDRPGNRETFGTSVEFERNPEEAARSAAMERKLTFVLHVSGNFEENRFT